MRRADRRHEAIGSAAPSGAAATTSAGAVCNAFLDDNVLLLEVGCMATLAVVVSAIMWIRFDMHSDAEARARGSRP
jgi:hypothetical protein